MDVMLDYGAKLPTRAHDTDAGLDLYSMEDGIIQPYRSRTFRTGVHIQLPPWTFGDVRPKSGLMFGRDLLTFGTIDEGYAGEIMVHMFNLGDDEYIVHAGDKIAQLAVVPIKYVTVNRVDSIKGGERGSDGFGSTGR